MYWWPHNEDSDVDIVMGCCMLVPRALIAQVGAFDPAFFVYSEEHDWCRRMQHAGLRVRFTPRAEMIHFGGQTSKRMSLRMALVQTRQPDPLLQQASRQSTGTAAAHHHAGGAARVPSAGARGSCFGSRERRRIGESHRVLVVAQVRHDRKEIVQPPTFERSPHV